MMIKRSHFGKSLILKRFWLNQDERKEDKEEKKKKKKGKETDSVCSKKRAGKASPKNTMLGLTSPLQGEYWQRLISPLRTLSFGFERRGYHDKINMKS